MQTVNFTMYLVNFIALHPAMAVKIGIWPWKCSMAMLMQVLSPFQAWLHFWCTNGSPGSGKPIAEIAALMLSASWISSLTSTSDLWGSAESVAIGVETWRHGRLYLRQVGPALRCLSYRFSRPRRGHLNAFCFLSCLDSLGWCYRRAGISSDLVRTACGHATKNSEVRKES